MNISKFEFVESFVSRHEYYDLMDSSPLAKDRKRLVDKLYKEFCQKSQKSQNSRIELINFINEFYDSMS